MKKKKPFITSSIKIIRFEFENVMGETRPPMEYVSGPIPGSTAEMKSLYDEKQGQ